MHASIIEHESLKAEIILCPPGAYFGKFTKLFAQTLNATAKMTEVLTIFHKNK